MRVNIGEPQDDGHFDIDVEIHPWDTWALDHTLALIIVPALEQLRDCSQSYPQDFEEFEDWTEAINKMLTALDECVIDGIKTNIEFQKKILKNAAFIKGDILPSKIQQH